MKNLRIYLVLALICVGMLVFNSCSEKAELIPENNNETTKELFLDKITIGDIETFINPVSHGMHLETEKREDDLKISKNLLELSLASRELFRDNAYNKIIHEKAFSNISKTFNLNEIDLHLKSSNVDIENIKSILNGIDLTRKVISNKKSAKTKTEQYIPAIFIPNLNTADYNLKPIISPGIDVNCEIIGLEDFEDYIIAWYYDDDNNLHEFFLNEEMAMKTKHPIFIFDNANEKLINISAKDAIVIDELLSEKMNNENKSVANWKSFSSNEYKLEHRFETVGKSEFWIIGLYVVPDFSRYEFLRSGGSRHEIAKVDKDDIGKQLYKWKSFNSWDLEPFDETHVFFNTYERDWNRSYKNFGTANASCHYSSNTMTIYLTGRAKYDSDWYTFDPDDPLPRIDMAGIYSSWAEWFESDNGNFRVWRVGD